MYFSDVPGCAFDRKWTGGLACVSNVFGGGQRNRLYDWNLGWRGAFELNMYANRLGLNHWDIMVGIVPWMRSSEATGLPAVIQRQTDELELGRVLD
jgi:hypothetical protein